VARAIRQGKTRHWIVAGALLSSVEFAGERTMTKVAVIGAGLIGRSWSIVFARAGFEVNLWDPFPRQTEAAITFIADRLPELRQAGLLAHEPADVLARITPAATMWEAVQNVVHVQENGPEQVPAKQALFAELDRTAAPDVVLASSTSGIPASAFTETLRHRGRCLVAHPVNPPYLVPLVEICPAPWTDAEVVERTRDLMQRAGQVPATVKKEMDGFALNRLQGALLAEAFRLLADDVISPADLDALVKHGLGLRWSFMGPLETIDLNAPGGLKDYCERYGPLYAKLQEQAVPLKWDAALVNRLHEAQRDELPLNLVPVRQEWRDRRLMALLAHKATQQD
jgi:L-gulonate 3-dehydrogenase